MTSGRNNIEKVRSSVDIAGIVEEYGIALKKEGKILKGLCPFHSEKTPSFTVYPENQSFYCFGCCKSGDVFAFVGIKENIPFNEALQKLANRTSIVLHHDSRNNRQTNQNSTEDCTFIYSEAFKLSKQALAEPREGRQTLNFLLSRGFTEESIKSLDVGAYTPGIRKHLQTQYGDEVLKKSGLASYGMGFNYQPVLPHRNANGSIVGLIMRLILKGAYTDGTPLPKYRFTVNLDKSVPFNLYNASREIGQKKDVIIVEGHLDALCLIAHGFKNTIALGGNFLSGSNIEHVKKCGAKNIYLFLDSDEPGCAGTEKAIKSLLDHAGLYPFVITLNQKYKDANEYFLAYNEHPNPGEAFLEHIVNAKMGWKWLASRMGQGIKGDKEKLLIIEDGEEIFLKISDPICQQDFLKSFATAIGVPLADLKKKYRVQPQTGKKARSNQFLNKVKLMIESDRSILEIQDYLKRFYFENKSKMSREEKSTTSFLNTLCTQYDMRGIKDFVDVKIKAQMEAFTNG